MSYTGDGIRNKNTTENATKISSLEREDKYFKEEKEVKKVNKIPYFEMKVVKVEGKKKEYCPRCGSEIIMEKPVGNWVNGENLDKIKFPCFCSYSNNDEKGIGLFSVNNNFYYITNINFQKKVQEDISGGCYDLKEFIIRNNIHVLKGKIIIFDEEEEKKSE